MEKNERGRSNRSGRMERAERTPIQRAGRVLEWIGGSILCAMVVATPWMFGTTEEWSVRLMNVGGFSAGGILLAAAICNRIGRGGASDRANDRVLKYVFLGLNLAVLVYCALALWNARATFSVEERSFEYRDEYNRSLPTTYDANLTQQTLLSLAACCAAFWGLRYWLGRGEGRRRDPAAPRWRNKRFELLLWVISLNGFAIALQGILQRLSGSAKLLWIRDSWWGKATACFGPFSYRGNAAEYLNLIWPVALGFWWILSRERKRRYGSSKTIVDGPELVLIPATIVMIAGSVISLSRGGAVVAMGVLFGIATFLALQKEISNRARVGVALFVLLTIGLVVFLGVGPLLKRFQNTGTMQDLGGRAEIYRNASQITKDYPIFGTGPGAFQSVYHLYRTEPKEEWHVFVHDDWLETRVSYGWVGFSIVVCNLIVLALWMATAARRTLPGSFSVCAAAGLAGALVHAKFDFPFQTYSIFFTFVTISSVMLVELKSSKAY